MSGTFVLSGTSIFDGESIHDGCGLLISEGMIAGFSQLENLPTDCPQVKISSGLLAPGFTDLQVNGGGGVLLNQQPTMSAIETICKAHLQFGTTGLLPTLITDTPEITTRAIEAGIQASSAGVPGFLGLHLEGPHLSPGKKGAHYPTLIRQMSDDDCDQLIAAKAQLPNLMVTVAPESVSNEQISRLAGAGIVVSLGHSEATFEQAKAARRAGASCLTHLYNAMSPLTHRKPGMVGAGLAPLGYHCGLIADGHHVDPDVIAISLAAKRGSGTIFLVSDAMATIGTDMKQFELNGRTIHRKDGHLTLADGTLAGADLELGSAVRFLVNEVGVELEEALRMACVYPQNCLYGTENRAVLAEGAQANIVHLDDGLNICGVWQEGEPLSDDL
jgi:N-acetylglucosamine-6-phosphate deacetylase